MKELMLIVERIVRPIRATQHRKLQMRQELLAHLQASYEEELQHSPQETALKKAAQRLGNPKELTALFQNSVPTWEKTLWARVTPDTRDDRELYLKRGALTTGHATLLTAVTLLTSAPLFVSLPSALRSADMQPIHLTQATAGALLGSTLLFLIGHNFTLNTASINPKRSSILKGATALLTLQLAMTAFLAYSVADRPVTPQEMLTCTLCTTLVLTVAAWIGNKIAKIRPIYDEWLRLEITE